MSATRDKTQKPAFVYSNLYQLYKTGKEAASQAVVPPPPPVGNHLAKGQVLKTADLKNEAVKIDTYRPAELIGKRLERPSNAAIDSLKDNLKSLTELHSRLRFMLKELEELIHD
jgi:hypothetical protein